MTFWSLAQIFLDLVFLGTLAIVWVKLNRPAKDDPRLSKGLQLLQSKIAVLEDLSDRTEVQVSQLTALLENKCREIQEKIVAADRELAKIDQGVKKSLEVAQIFQDRIPHGEILERQNTMKYVKAARLAHQGATVDQIASQVDLSRGELEFIAKVNREQLQFSEEDLPAWAREGADVGAPVAAPEASANISFALPRENFERAFEASAPAPASQQGLQKLGEEFKQAIREAAVENAGPSVSVPQGFVELTPSAPTPTPAKPAAPAPTPADLSVTMQTSSGKMAQVRPLTFPKIEINRNLG